MQFQTKQLKKVMPILKRTLATANSMPILSDVQFHPNPKRGVMRLVTTDLEQSTGVDVWCGQSKGDTDMPFAIAHKELAAFLKTADDDIVSIDCEGNSERATLVTGEAMVMLRCALPDAVPTPQSIHQSEWTKGTPQMVAAMDAVVHSVSVDETRYNLNGVYIKPSEVGTLFIATDGHRLSLRDVAGAHFKSVETPIIVPRRFWLAAGMLARKAPERCKFASDGRYWAMRMGSVEIITRLIEGEFPNYTQVIPDYDRSHTVHVNREEMLAAVRTISVGLREETSKEDRKAYGKWRNKPMRFSFVNANTVCVEATNSDSVVTLNHETIVSAGLVETQVCFRAKYVIEMLESLHFDTVSMCVPNDLGPVRFDDGYGGEALEVVMPMRA